MASPEKSSLAANPIKYEPSTCFKISKEQVKQIKIGDEITVNVSGRVIGMRECFDNKTQFDVDLRPFKVSGLAKK